MPESSSVCAVVVNWNGGPRLVDSVQSLLSQEGVDVQVRVVDNGSSDDSLSGLARGLRASDPVEVIEAGENIGFGSGVNRGFRGTDWGFGTCMNTDVRLDPGSLAKLVGFLKATPGAGLVGPRLVGPGGGIEESLGFAPSVAGEICRKFLLHLVFRFAKFRRRSPEGLARVGWVTGACMAFRRDAFMQVGGMDEAIFMYYEDVDLCLRLVDAGWDVYHLPEAVARHQGKASSSLVMEPMLVSSAVSHRYVMERHLGRRASALLAGLTPVEMMLRSFLWRLKAVGDGKQEALARLSAYRRIPGIVASMQPGTPPRVVSEQGVLNKTNIGPGNPGPDNSDTRISAGGISA